MVLYRGLDAFEGCIAMSWLSYLFDSFSRCWFMSARGMAGIRCEPWYSHSGQGSRWPLTKVSCSCPLAGALQVKEEMWQKGSLCHIWESDARLPSMMWLMRRILENIALLNDDTRCCMSAAMLRDSVEGISTANRTFNSIGANISHSWPHIKHETRLHISSDNGGYTVHSVETGRDIYARPWLRDIHSTRVVFRRVYAIKDLNNEWKIIITWRECWFEKFVWSRRSSNSVWLLLGKTIITTKDQVDNALGSYFTNDATLPKWSSRKVLQDGLPNGSIVVSFNQNVNFADMRPKVTAHRMVTNDLCTTARCKDYVERWPKSSRSLFHVTRKSVPPLLSW